MKALILALLLFAAPALAEVTPNFIQQPDGSWKVGGVEITGASGIVYACFSESTHPSLMLCFTIQPDGKVIVVRANAKGTTA